MPPRFVKSHGLGNDYLVLHEGPTPSPAQVTALCHRHLGYGADGVLTPGPAGEADYGLRIFNADGSEAEKSGNGIRIYARYLVDHRGAPDRFTLSTLGGLVRCEVGPEQVTVQMGRARFDPAGVPVRRSVAEVVEQPIEVLGQALTFTAVGLGNPHCVVFTEKLGAEMRDLDALPWRAWGEALEVHPDFPNKTNVQFVRVLDPGRLELRIWERGSGETSASGSSSCAVAAAAVKTGRCAPGELSLLMPGGQLQVRVGPDYALTLRGPVEEIGMMTPSPRWWSSLQG